MSINKLDNEIRLRLNKLHNDILKNTNVTRTDLYESYKKYINEKSPLNGVTKSPYFWIITIVLSILILIVIITPAINVLFGVRCFIPNNYLVWEATRPISDCQYCKAIDKPLILRNMTRDEFLVRLIFLIQKKN